MKTTTYFQLLIILASGFICAKTDAQVYVDGKSPFDVLEGGTTYVITSDQVEPDDAEYLKIIEENWTFNKLKFIQQKDKVKYISEKSMFVEIRGYTSTYNSGSTSLRYTNVSFNIRFWSFHKRFLKKKNADKFDSSDMETVARIDLYPKFTTIENYEDVIGYGYNLSDKMYNYSPGVFKNYIQHVNTYLVNKARKSVFGSPTNREEFEKLKTNTLYIPEYILHFYNADNGDESKMRNVKDLFKDYPYAYQLISSSELSKKILTDAEPFYYLTYQRDVRNIYSSVINSSTGEFIYGHYRAMKFNFDDRDVERIVESLDGDE